MVGDNNHVFPYVVLNTVEDYSTITVPAGTVVKLNFDTYIYVFEYLNLQSTAANPIVFTSYLDDTYAGDTNADGSASQPGLSDWKTIWLIDTPTKINHIHDVIAKHATAAVGVYFPGYENTAVNSSITDSTFEENHAGIVLAIGYEKHPYYTLPGKGNIISVISNTKFIDNSYGLLTYASHLSTGIAQPELWNNQFSNTTFYPIYLGGTAFPEYYSGNIIAGSASSQLSLPNGQSAGGQSTNSLALALPTISDDMAQQLAAAPTIVTA